jgi:hypothetical protein
MNTNQIQDLEKKLNVLKDAHTALSKSHNIDDLLKIIHHPGWTTVAEHAFANSLVDSMISHTQLLQSMHKSLFEASQQVGRK